MSQHSRVPPQFPGCYRFLTFPAFLFSLPSLAVGVVDAAVVPKAPRRWRKGMLLGTGAFGKVYLALDEDTGAEIAVKIVDLFTGDEESRKAVEALEGEIQMLHSLKHPRIVTYLGTERTSETLCILMEYVPGVS